MVKKIWEFFSPKNVFIISDCRDENARMRLEIAAAREIPGAKKIFFTGVENDFEAAGCIIDALAQNNGAAAVFLVNVAPRDYLTHNGSPFGLIKIGNIFVFSTIQGYTLQLLAKLQGKSLDCKIFDVEKTSHKFFDIPLLQRAEIFVTQFRSLEFLPRLARQVILGKKLSPVPIKIDAPQPDVHHIWWIDNFGNMKTTMLPQEVGFRTGMWSEIETSNGQHFLKCCHLISEVAQGDLGIKIGSSGLPGQRFLEIFCRGRNAAQVLGANTGDIIHLVDLKLDQPVRKF